MTAGRTTQSHLPPMPAVLLVARKLQVLWFPYLVNRSHVDSLGVFSGTTRGSWKMNL